MEYVEGESLDEFCDRRRLSVSERLELFRRVCAAVEYAHALQVVHRDLKPSNILVKPDGTPKLLDWARDRGERFDHCVLGEPTNPGRLGEMIKIGRRGSLTGEIVVEGRQGHVAYPHLADNPIPRLMTALAALKAEPLDAGTAHFDP